MGKLVWDEERQRPYERCRLYDNDDPDLWERHFHPSELNCLRVERMETEIHEAAALNARRAGQWEALTELLQDEGFWHEVGEKYFKDFEV